MMSKYCEIVGKISDIDDFVLFFLRHLFDRCQKNFSLQRHEKRQIFTKKKFNWKEYKLTKKYLTENKNNKNY